MSERWKNVWAFAIALVLMTPTYVTAGTSTGETGEGIRFPNDKDGNAANVETGKSGEQRVHLMVGGCPNIRTVTPLSGPQAGEVVGRETINALCEEAVNPPQSYTCNGIVDGAFCSGIGCCSAMNDAATQRITCVKDCSPSNLANPLDEFILHRQGGSNWVDAISRTGTPIKLGYQTKAGNSFEIDLGPIFNIGLDRLGFDGVFTATFGTDVNDPNSVSSVSVDSTDPNVVDPNASPAEQDRQLHQAMADGIIALGLGLDARCTAGYSAESVSSNPDLFGGTLLHIPNMLETNVAVVGLSGPEGAAVTGETTVISGELIPTLSEWGLILLVAVLFLTGTWMLRRRRLGQAT